MSNEQRNWYIVRATYSREMSVKRYFDRLKVRSYVPMHYVETQIGGRRRLVQRPVVHNLVFVRITPAWLQKIRQSAPVPIGLYYDRSSSEPAVVPDKEMDDFLFVTGGRFDDTPLIDLQRERLDAGDRVRITEGVFKGVEGEYLRYGSKQRVVVKLQGLLAVATAEIPAHSVERI
ncbi:UpxY family transcription antiterminator [Alistipes sp.]|uniref:UpxY family transcription antiterminator n=1 Tax=Alistipes sp. TaxID=1872444 RepID=UPI003A856346